MTNRILIVDDDKDLCALIQKCIRQEGFEAASVHTGVEGLQKLRESCYAFDLVILDIMLPGANGFQVLSELRRESDIPVLMLTAKDSETDKVSGLRMGADDYLTKPFSLQELLARVQSLVRRYTGFYRTAETLHVGKLCLNTSERSVTVDGNAVELTSREFDLLLFLAQHPGQVFTKKQIYTQVWQDDYAFDDNNIMAFISKLRKKIEPDAEHPSYIQTVRGVGYRFAKE